VKIWKRVWGGLRGSPSSANPPTATPEADDDPHTARARESLRALVDDPAVPEAVRAALADEFDQVQAMLDKLEYGHLHIAVFGRVGVGKSALLNALLGEPRFVSGPLHGETREATMAEWHETEAGGVYLIDTPGINEVDGAAREKLAHEVAGRADLVLFVVEGDLSAPELEALRLLAAEQRPLLLVLNKVDRYSRNEREALLATLAERVAGLVTSGCIVEAAAAPAEQMVIRVDDAGVEHETTRQPSPAVEGLRARLWTILEAEGKSLAAVNASLFAGRLSDDLARRMVALKRELADRVVRNWCVAKGVVVGLNPIPVADIVGAAVVDASLVVHLSRIYGLPMSRNEAGALVSTIGKQMLLVIGTVWAVNFVSSALKLGTAGLSTLLTAAAQGAVAYYATWVVGQAARRYLEQGRSWGKQGPKRVVADILANADRESLLAEAREEILARLKRAQKG
jgi:GTP-binding protein Era